jgi:hypothetical protein
MLCAEITCLSVCETVSKLVNKYQQDVTLQYFYFLFFNISTCFGHDLAHHQEITRLAAHAVSGEVTL